MRLFIIRHADPDYENDTITPAGHLEAAALADRLGSHGLDMIYSSSMGRAMATAGYTADRLGLTLESQEWMRELSHWKIQERGLGTTCVWDIHGQTVRAHQPPLHHQNWFEAPPLDDPAFFVGFEALKNHSDEFLERLGYVRDGGVYRIRRANRMRVAVFCHAGFGLTWLAHLLEIPLPLMWSSFFLAASSVTTVLFDERSRDVAVPRCLSLGDTSHLYQAGLPVQPAGLRGNAT
ncbi:MAG: histidine phosphatase family protein [Planctomycetota bacterium]|nr:histidine phosphatase family protein [Planctomycetota bacterium]